MKKIILAFIVACLPVAAMGYELDQEERGLVQRGLNAGRADFKKGDFNSAKGLLALTIAMDPDAFLAYLTLAEIALAEKKQDEAQKYALMGFNRLTLEKWKHLTGETLTPEEVNLKRKQVSNYFSLTSDMKESPALAKPDMGKMIYFGKHHDTGVHIYKVGSWDVFYTDMLPDPDNRVIARNTSVNQDRASLVIRCSGNRAEPTVFYDGENFKSDGGMDIRITFMSLKWNNIEQDMKASGPSFFQWTKPGGDILGPLSTIDRIILSRKIMSHETLGIRMPLKGLDMERYFSETSEVKKSEIIHFDLRGGETVIREARRLTQKGEK